MNPRDHILFHSIFYFIPLTTFYFIPLSSWLRRACGYDREALSSTVDVRCQPLPTVDAGSAWPWLHAEYIMYSTFLISSSGSVLFDRSNLLKRKDLCFSCLRLVLLRHRSSLRSTHLSSVCNVFRVVHLDNWLLVTQPSNLQRVAC